MSKELKQLFDEVMGVGEAVTPTVEKPQAKPSLLKRLKKVALDTMTKLQVQRAVELFRTEAGHKKQIKDLQSRIKDIEKRNEGVRNQIRVLVQRRGIPLIERPQDLVLHLPPFKAQLENRVTRGDIHDIEPIAAWAKLNAPQLILHQVDLGLIRKYVDGQSLTEEQRKDFQKAFRLIEGVAALVDGASEMRLDLAVYEEMRDKIPQKVREKAETPDQTKEYLSIDVLPGKHRCKGCGNKSIQIGHPCRKCGVEN